MMNRAPRPDKFPLSNWAISLNSPPSSIGCFTKRTQFVRATGESPLPPVSTKQTQLSFFHTENKDCINMKGRKYETNPNVEKHQRAAM
jgi:hypothetical protein